MSGFRRMRSRCRKRFRGNLKRFRVLARVAVVAPVCFAVTGQSLVAHAQVLTASPSGTAYYVDNSAGCSDANPGTSLKTPWCDFTPVNSTTFQPGDRIMLKGGDTWDGQLHPQGSGIAGRAITISDYGRGAEPVINGEGTANETGAVYLYNQQYWTIQNLTVTNNPGTQDTTLRSGIQVTDNGGGELSGITIRNNYVHDVWSAMESAVFDTHAFGGIAVNVLSPEGSSDIFNGVTIRGNRVHQAGRMGITVWGSSWSSGDTARMYPENLTSTRVDITHNTVNYAYADSLLLYGTNGGVVDHNVAADGASCDSSVCAAQFTDGIWSTRAYNTTIQYNESYGESCNQGDGEGFDADIDLSNAIYQYNYSHDNCSGFLNVVESGIVPDSNIIVRFNISQGDGTGRAHGVLSMESYSGSQMAPSGFYFYNNTIYMSPGTYINVIFDYPDCVSSTNPFYFDNNIIDNQNGGNYAGDCGGASFSHNLMYGQHPSDEPADQLTSNPQFVKPGGAGAERSTASAYELLKCSPALRSGELIADNGGQDFFGNPVSPGSPPNIGAYNGPGASPAHAQAVVSGPTSLAHDPEHPRPKR